MRTFYQSCSSILCCQSRRTFWWFFDWNQMPMGVKRAWSWWCVLFRTISKIQPFPKILFSIWKIYAQAQPQILCSVSACYVCYRLQETHFHYIDSKGRDRSRIFVRVDHETYMYLVERIILYHCPSFKDLNIMIFSYENLSK